MTHEVLGELSQHTLTDATEIDLIGGARRWGRQFEGEMWEGGKEGGKGGKV